MNKKTFRSILLLILAAAAAVLAVWKIEWVLQTLSFLISVISPLIIGFVIAFILNKPYSAIYSVCHKGLQGKSAKASHTNPQSGPKKREKLAKPISIILTYLLFFGIIVLVFVILIPQLIKSMQTLISNIGTYAQNLEGFYKWLTAQLNVTGITQEDIAGYLQSIYEAVLNAAKGILPTIFNFTQGVVQTVVNIVVGVTVSLYFLADKEHLKSQAKRLMFSYLPEKATTKILYVANIANTTFSSFINGQLTEAFILGILCFISMTIFRFPYALLISFIIGLTNLIPIIGPIIGTIPGAFIILMVNPRQAVWFVILVIILQQIDGNIIYPRVVGTSVGLPALWVLVAVTVGGSLFGLTGMIIAVPTFSVIYKLIKADTQQRLEEKQISPETYQS